MGGQVLGWGNGGIFGVGGECVAEVAGRAAIAVDDDFFPAGAVRVVAIFVAQLTGLGWGEGFGGDAEYGEAAGAIGDVELGGLDDGVNGPAIDGEMKVRDPSAGLLEGFGIELRARAGALEIPFAEEFKAGDFREIEGVEIGRAHV